MGFIKDIIPIFKKHEIEFEKSFKEISDIYTFIFRSDKRINWKPGQHGVFTITHDKIKKPTRAFSIASTAEDEYIEISTRIGEKPSEFKQALMNLKSGMKMSMRGPIGGFYVHDSRPTLLIAGGIGITPFKSIVKYSNGSSRIVPEKLHLLYIDSKEEFIYQNDFNKAAENNQLSVEYLSKREDLTESIEKFVKNYKNNGNYFIVGSPNMIKSISVLLKNHEIKKKNIIKDTFIGY